MNTRDQTAIQPASYGETPAYATSTPGSATPGVADRSAMPEAQRDQALTIPGVRWEEYVRINDAFVERRPARMIYSPWRLTLLVTSRRHDWIADFFGDLVKAVALGCGLEWEIGGRATYRGVDAKGGIEGDKSFYFGANAERMRGPVNIDLATQPPPDLAIEVEVTHPADHALVTWGLLGGPEVWRFDAESWRLTYWIRRADGSYAESPASMALPMLRPEEAVAQLRLHEELGSARWARQAPLWVAETLVPRAGGAG